MSLPTYIIEEIFMRFNTVPNSNIFGTIFSKEANIIYGNITNALYDLYNVDKEAYNHIMNINDKVVNIDLSCYSFSKLVAMLKDVITANMGLNVTFGNLLKSGYNLDTSICIVFLFNALEKAVYRSKKMLEKCRKLAIIQKNMNKKVLQSNNRTLHILVNNVLEYNETV